MLHDLLWFLAGGWIGSILTLVMVALMRRNSELPKPYDETTAPNDQPVKSEANSPNTLPFPDPNSSVTPAPTSDSFGLAVLQKK